MATSSWTYEELRAELQEFDGLKPSSIQTYTDRTDRFLRWLVGDYTPRGPVA